MTTAPAADTEVLLIGGRSGVGKSTVGWEVSRQLRQAGVPHCFIEGDNLDQIHPAPDGDPVRQKISEANLAAVWANYKAAGHRRLIYTNTASVLSEAWMTRALGGAVKFFGVLLTANDETAGARLQQREIGGGLSWHRDRSRRAALWLAAETPPWVVRVATDERTVVEIATEAIALTGWSLGSFE